MAGKILVTRRGAHGCSQRRGIGFSISGEFTPVPLAGPAILPGPPVKFLNKPERDFVNRYVSVKIDNGNRLLESGDSSGAMEFYTRAINLNPTVNAGWNNLSVAARKAGLFNAEAVFAECVNAKKSAKH